MKNLAGSWSESNDLEIISELEQAGIQYFKLVEPRGGEVKSIYLAYLDKTGWTFERAWRYWVARWGPPCKPITMEQANRLFASHGSEVRCGGSCLGPSPEKEFGKDGIPYFYHVDTQAGLNELVKIILENRTIPQEA